ncbi:cytochrome P450 [Aspergillus lentulus]|uniref:Uncharacterized protein n=1 Tax=Aspergillus lentulus TaxID=293939 RepID=A0AAN5YHB7_ASPLE|nr:cytochrome P450 [Aspergillus lentulus]KAF4155470.1 hypothetical protein CNMCM6069_007991 [Aspergillus lentulus]KAF4163374.1 hypothetical protein CNMCM6936_000890 [Aspergillus lentulus]KAF4200568.1 hypothetical protein CNMCM8927_002830 [Aspergillus lentulus]GFF28979.1 cytochrome P450 [Aspergillus lentulus]GFG14242.1 cytochrome P450 [Aspergillus lentulus]
MIQPEVSRHISVSNIGHGISARTISPNFHGTSGTVDIASAMAEITIFTAGSTLREKRCGQSSQLNLPSSTMIWMERMGPSGTLAPLQFKDIDNLPLHQNVIRETLRLHGSIHSLLRKVKNPLPVPDTP